MLAAGWGVQAVALPAPKSAARVIADASVWLHEHRLVVDRFAVDGRRRSAACLRTRAGTGRRRRRHGSLLSFGPNSARFFRLGTGRASVLAGCSGPLELLLARAVQTGADMELERAYAAHQPALALGIQRVRDARVTLYVSPRTFRPLVAIVHADNRTVKARLYLARPSSALLQQFDLQGESP